jgi:single-strand binding protein
VSDTIVIRGFTASNPTLAALPNGVPVVNFRLASTPRWQDATGTWKEGTTNWYTIKAYRRLAQNIAVSVQKGQPLVISGRQRINRWNREDGTQGTTVEIDAQGIGHDLNYGTSSFARTVEKRALHEDAPLGALPNTPQGAPDAVSHVPQNAELPSTVAQNAGVQVAGAPGGGTPGGASQSGGVQGSASQGGGAQSDEPPF